MTAAKVLRDEIIELEYHPEREDSTKDMKINLKIKFIKDESW